MKELIFATGNNEKFIVAKHACDNYGIDLKQQSVEIDEIQSEDPEKVALDKATKIYNIVKKPVVTTDDSWAFMGLNGFPGIYMHSINQWFTPNDMLRLTRDLTNRKVTMAQYLVYTDGETKKVFVNHTNGVLLKESRGPSKYPGLTLIALDGDNGLSVSEAYSSGKDQSNRRPALVWCKFAEWFVNYK